MKIIKIHNSKFTSTAIAFGSELLVHDLAGSSQQFSQLKRSKLVKKEYPSLPDYFMPEFGLGTRIVLSSSNAQVEAL